MAFIKGLLVQQTAVIDQNKLNLAQPVTISCFACCYDADLRGNRRLKKIFRYFYPAHRNNRKWLKQIS